MQTKLNKVVKQRFFDLCESDLDWPDFLLSLNEIRDEFKDLSREDVKILKEHLQNKMKNNDRSEITI